MTSPVPEFSDRFSVASKADWVCNFCYIRTVAAAHGGAREAPLQALPWRGPWGVWGFGYGVNFTRSASNIPFPRVTQTKYSPASSAETSTTTW